MRIKYTLTNTILNQIYNFAELHGRLYSYQTKNKWSKELAESIKKLSGFAAVSVDKNLPDNLDITSKTLNLDKFLQRSTLDEYIHYTRILDQIGKLFTNPAKLGIDFIDAVHLDLLNLNNPIEHRLRTRVRILPKPVWDNGVFKTIKLEVKTRPEEIMNKLYEFTEWLRENFASTNSLLLAGICHYKIAEIHPYDDANGRLSRIFDRGILSLKKVDNLHLLPIEDFYLRNRERYYQLIEHTIESNDLTEWLEFYTEGLLYSINSAIDILLKLSGGTINIYTNEYIDLTPKEEELVKIIRDLNQASGAEIAKKLHVSRQNVSIMLRKLTFKNVLTRVGENTSSRYKLALTS